MVNEAGDSDNTVAVTAGEVSVLFAANDAMVVKGGQRRLGSKTNGGNKSRKVKRLTQ